MPDLVELLDNMPMSRTGRPAASEDTLNKAIIASLSNTANPDVAETARAIVGAVRRKALPLPLARDVLARLLPPLGTANIVPTIELHEAQEPMTTKAYRETMRVIWRAAIKEGRIGLDEARKAMILTKTLWRAELETMGREDGA